MWAWETHISSALAEVGTLHGDVAAVEHVHSSAVLHEGTNAKRGVIGARGGLGQPQRTGESCDQ